MINKTKLLGTLLGVISCGIMTIDAQNYSGKYSSEGDITAKGIMTMELTQNKSKIEGVANYKTYNEDLDTGVLSVNGYVKEGTAYIRVRDQRGGVVADGDIHFQGGNSTLHFTQSTSSSQLPKSAYLYNTSSGSTSPAPPMTPTNGNFNGKYSSEGDTTAKGMMKFEMQQRGSKLEGIATYETYDGGVKSGVLSVNGYAKGGVGYIRFRDQKANVIADGTLTKSESGYVFTQTTDSSWLPKKAYLYQ